MPVYTQNITSTETWVSQVASTFSPVVILQEPGRVRIVADTQAAADVKQPDQVISFWSEFHRHHAELAQEPVARNYESHWVFDEQVGYGYANATKDRIAFPAIALPWALRTQTGNEDWWLFGHELGHQFQTGDWTGGDITEVAVNLFTMYTLNDYIFSGSSNQILGGRPDTVDHTALIGMTWATADFFGKLQLYKQLITELGWESMQVTFASYYDENYPRDTYGSNMDGFAIRYSALNQIDISEFLQRWQYPVSSGAVDRIKSFNYPVWLPPGW